MDRRELRRADLVVGVVVRVELVPRVEHRLLFLAKAACVVREVCPEAARDVRTRRVAPGKYVVCAALAVVGLPRTHVKHLPLDRELGQKAHVPRLGGSGARR